MRTNVDVEAGGQIFHRSGERQDAGPAAVDTTAPRPALFAAYRDLNLLRYDFPLVLAAGDAQGGALQSLSRAIDRLLQRVAPPGPTSEALRRLVLHVERDIRTLAAQGVTGTLADLWDRAAETLQAAAPASTVKIARAALDIDGEVVDCNATTANRVVDHLWGAVQEDKARSFRTVASRLAVKLDDILRADFLRSAAGRGADSLAAGVGSPHRQLFDFSAMSRLLPKSSARETLPASRRRRIEWALATVTGQRFFATSVQALARAPHAFRFESCVDALAAYRARLPEVAELVKALSVAELEVDGRYDEAHHDGFFAAFDQGSLGAGDLAMFPDYLVTLADRGDGAQSGLMEALSSGVPLKVVLNIDDLHRDMGRDGPSGQALRGAQVASMATGLDIAFVLQSTSSNLYRMREQLRRGLGYAGPALFCVFSGAASRHGSEPAYLGAAAALESRAFPSFTFDPDSGPDLASRFSLDGNPQPERDWPLHRLAYADGELGRVAEEVAFTLVDFLAADGRNARHFTPVGRDRWSDRMVPVAQHKTDGGDVPFVLAVDADGHLTRLAADDRMIAAARRCLDTWHRLQELGGVHNSHAERLVARERAEWEKQKQAELEILKASAGVVAAPSPPIVPAAGGVPAAAPPVAAAAPERSPDEPTIETARCSSCNECILINDRMFAYNDNKQAYIADLGAGTFRQLVEAAESCQLGIIHPGKPRDPGEPGLDELIERAAPFA